MAQLNLEIVLLMLFSADLCQVFLITINEQIVKTAQGASKKRKLFGRKSQFIAFFTTQRLQRNRGFCAFFRICSFIVDYNQCNLTPKVWECRTEGFQRAIADFVCSHCPLVASAEAKSPAQGCNHSNKYPSITFKVLSAPSRWLRSYPCDAYTPAPISPWRMSYPARKVASTSDP